MYLILSILLSAFITVTSCDANHKQEPCFTSLSAEEFEKAIADTSIIRVDVRSQEEWAEGHIERTIVLDVQKDDFLDKSLLTLPKDKTVAVNCRTGKRSKMAAGILCGAGYTVIELNTGFFGWLEAGKPVTKD